MQSSYLYEYLTNATDWLRVPIRWTDGLVVVVLLVLDLVVEEIVLI